MAKEAPRPINRASCLLDENMLDIFGPKILWIISLVDKRKEGNF